MIVFSVTFLQSSHTYYEVYSLPRTEEVPEGYITR